MSDENGCNCDADSNGEAGKKAIEPAGLLFLDGLLERGNCRVLLGDDGVFVSDDAIENAGLDLAEGVVALQISVPGKDADDVAELVGRNLDASRQGSHDCVGNIGQIGRMGRITGDLAGTGSIEQ